MARVHGPLHADKASGKFAGMIYTSWLGRPYVRRRPLAVHQPGTPAQRANWSRFAAAHAAWKQLPPAEKAAWTARGAADNLPGYHAFMHVNAKAEK
jgi:hypothetical protein